MLFISFLCAYHLQTWYAQADTKQKVKSTTSLTTTETGTEFQVRLMALCKRGKAQGKQQEVRVVVDPHDVKEADIIYLNHMRCVKVPFEAFWRHFLNIRRQMWGNTTFFLDSCDLTFNL